MTDGLSWIDIMMTSSVPRFERREMEDPWVVTGILKRDCWNADNGAHTFLRRLDNQTMVLNLSLYQEAVKMMKTMVNLYTGSGGRDLSGNKRTNKLQSFEQKFESFK